MERSEGESKPQGLCWSTRRSEAERREQARHDHEKFYCGTFNWNDSSRSVRVKTIKLKFSEACMILENYSRTRRMVLQVGQANKSARGMPWHQEPMKDVTSCDKLRGAAHTH